MRFELRSGEELWLPAELVDGLDHTLIHEGFMAAWVFLYNRTRLELHDGVRLLRRRERVLNIESVWPSTFYASRCDAV